MMGMRTHDEPSVPCSGSRCRTFRLLFGSHVEERLEVLTELLFLRDRRLGAGPEEHGCCCEVLGGLFGNGYPKNTADDVAA
jgi:hypothetical protein